MRLSQHFTLEELTNSDLAIRKGIDNNPDAETFDNLAHVATNLELVRSVLGNHPLRINSGFRCDELNRLVGGSKTSAHLEGWAVDFTCPEYGTPRSVCIAIDSSGIDFDQLIYEGTWVHISFKPTNRREVLTAHFNNGKATYTKGL